MSQQWINFAELRKQLNFGTVLKSYNVKLTPKGGDGQFVGECPLPQHGERKGQPFSANLNEGLFQCFGCKEKGNVIDFAVLMAGKDKRDGKAVREVAASLRDRFLQKQTSHDQGERPNSPPDGKRLPKDGVVNQPLDFALKTLEADHPYFHDHGLSRETVERFGLGFCKRGSLSGRVAVPLCDDSSQLIGYAGLILNESGVSEASPRYVFPTEREVDGVLHMFKKGRFLYNGFRVGKSVKDLIVVPECHLVWSLWQAGFANVVALMGYECSREQANFVPMLTAENARIWLVAPSGKEGLACAESLLPKVASNRMCKWLIFEDAGRIAPNHPLLALLPKR